MDIFVLTEHALSKPAATEEFPFGEHTFVYKVNGKIFMLASQDEGVVSMNLKCDPDKAVELREEYPGIIVPGYHMNKKHWNTIQFIDGHGLKLSFIKEMIDHSYLLVAPKKK